MWNIDFLAQHKVSWMEVDITFEQFDNEMQFAQKGKVSCWEKV